MQHAQKMVLVSPETLTALKDPRPVSSETFTRSKLDHEMKELLEKTDLTPYDKVQRYNQILQRYLTFYNQTTKRPMNVKITQDRQPDLDPPIVPENDNQNNDQSKDDEDATKPEDGTNASPYDEKLLANFPVSIKKKAKTIFDMIQNSNGILDYNDKGELLLDGHVIRGSHISDLVYDILFGKSGFEPRGVEQFLGGLVRLNVPERLITNKTRRSMLRQMKQSAPSESRKRVVVVTPSRGKRRKSSLGISKSGRKTSKTIGRLNWESYT